MKNVIKVLGNSLIWVYALQVVSIIGLVSSDDIKTAFVFGAVYIGACIESSMSRR